MSLSPEQIPTPAALQERLQARRAQQEEMGQLLPFSSDETQASVAEPLVAAEAEEAVADNSSQENAEPVQDSETSVLQEPKASRSSGKLELADLVHVGKTGRAHVSGSYNPDGRSRNGQFLSKYEIEQIEAHEEQIRKGLGKLAAERGLGNVDEKNRAHRENGQLMSNKELAALLGNNKYVHPEESAEEEQANDQELDQVVTELSQATPASPEEPVAAETSEESQSEETATTGTEEAVRLTLKQRIVRRLKHAGRQLYLAPVNVRNALQKAGDYLNDEEKGRRRGIVAGVVGVAAVGGAVMAYKYGGDLFSHAADAHPKGAVPNKDLADLLSGNGGASGKHDQSVLDALQGNHSGGAEAVQTHLTLERGGTIWDSLSQQGAEHGHHLSDAQLHELTSQTLKANGLSWEDARQLPAGYQFNIPPEVLAEL